MLITWILAVPTIYEAVPYGQATHTWGLDCASFGH